MNIILHDLRYATRLMLQQPGLTIVIVVALALGIGANTALFSVVNAVLLRPLPYRNANRIVMLEGNFQRLQMENLGASPPEFVDYRARAQSFDEVAAFNNAELNLTGIDEPERITGARVSDNLFQLLGAQPLMGRAFTKEECEVGRDKVALLSYGLWQRRYGADPGIAGKQLTLGGESYTILGVMPQDFQFPYAGFSSATPAELFVPLAFDEEELQHRSSYNLKVLALLKTGVSLKQAQAEMTALAARFEEEYPKSYRGPRGEDGGWNIKAVPLDEEVTGSIRPALLILLGAVGFVLLIACANVANLLLARGMARQKEVAIRLALGASRSRLIRQFLTESILLALTGGTVGLLFALWGNDLLVALDPANVPRLREISLDARVLFFTLAVSILTGVIFGLVPALQASRPDLNQSLKDGARGSLAGALRHNRVRSLLVISEVALSLVLLISAGLMLKSFAQLRRVNPGFNAENVLTMEIALPESKYADAASRARFFNQLLERAAQTAGVREAGVVSALPLSGADTGGPYSIEGRPFDPNRRPSFASYRTASAGYFHVMQIALRAGRSFTEQDTAEQPAVGLINETMARTAFAGEDPIGKRIKLGAPTSPRPWLTIVGVVADVKESGLEAATRPEIYAPYQQDPTRRMTLTVNTPLDTTSMTAALRGAVLSLDKEQPVYNIRTMRQVLANAVSQRQFSTLLFGLFAALALLLSVTGIYGVISYTVTQRTHEIGVRMALGAQSSDVLSLIVGQGLRLTLVGIAIGFIAAFAATRLMKNLLFEVSATDPATYLLISLLLLLVALLASLIPARRATKVDPMVALRYE